MKKKKKIDKIEDRDIFVRISERRQISRERSRHFRSTIPKFTKSTASNGDFFPTVTDQTYGVAIIARRLDDKIMHARGVVRSFNQI